MITLIASKIPETNFSLYIQFTQQVLLFFFPAAIGVICSLLIKEFKTPENNKKKIEFFRFIIRSITWAIPSAVIVCIIDIIIGDGLSEEMRMAIFGFTFFVGMIGEEIAIIFTNMRIWIKVSKEIIKELGECIGKADICKTIGDTIEDEMNKELEKEDK